MRRSLRLVLAALLAAPTLQAQARGGPALADALPDALLDARIPATDDADARAARLLDAVAAQPRSPAAALACEAIGVAAGRAREPRRIADGLRGLLARGDLHGSARAAALEQLAELLDVLGEPAAADALDAFGAYATRWLAVGPFGDSGDAYDGVPFPPEVRFPAPGTVLAGRFGPVTPRVVVREPDRAAVAFGEGAPDPRGCLYGLHQVRTDTALAGYVEVRTGGSFELFVDGVRVGGVDRLRTRTDRVVHVPVALSSGVHHVLVKTTLSARSEVALRYVDARGAPLAGVTELAPDRVHEPSTAADGPPPPPAFVGPLDALLRDADRAETTPEATAELTAALYAFDGGRADAGNQLLFELAQAPPRAARARLALAEVWRAAPDVPPEIRDGEARRLLESVTDELPDHHLVLMRRVDLLRGDDRIEDAIRLVRARADDAVRGPDAWDKLADLLDALGARAEATHARRAWLAAHPLDVRPRRALARDRGGDGDPAGALELIDAGLRLLPGHRALLADARALAVDLGDRERALALVDRMHRAAPDGPDALRARARTLWELGDGARAVALWQRCAAGPDATPSDLRGLGLAMWRAGARDAGREALAASLALEPSQHELRRLLGHRPERPDFPAIARFRSSEAEIDAMVAGFEPTAREAAAPSTLVLDRMTVELLPDGGYVQEVHQLRRINDLRGVEAHEEATAAARADELVRLRTLGVDGASYVPKRVGGSFAMPRLEPGAFVEELWRDFVDAPGEDPWRAPSFLFRGQDAPFLLTEFVLILPPGHPGSVRSRGFPPEPERIALDDGREALRFRATDVPRLRPERLTPPLEELVPVVTYGEERSPGAIARMLRVGATTRTRITPWVAAATAAVIDGVAGDRARAAAIHRWVHETIAVERGSPEPTATLLRRQGPRFFLEVAMLDAAGVPLRLASAADVAEPMADEPPPLFPGDAEFGVPAARIQPRDGEPLWLFADLPRHAPLGFVAASRAGAAVLFADDGATRRLPAATETAPGWEVTGRISLVDDGDALFDVELSLRDEQGYGLAQQIRDLDANRRTLAGRSIGAQLFPGWTVVDAQLATPAPGEHFRSRLTLRRRGAVQAAGDRAFLPLLLPPTRAYQRYGDQGPREQPLRLSGATLEDWDVVVDPGDAWQIAAVPEGLRLCGAMLDYDLALVPADGTVRIRRRVAVRPGTLAAARFAEWTDALRGVDRAEDGRIELLER